MSKYCFVRHKLRFCGGCYYRTCGIVIFITLVLVQSYVVLKHRQQAHTHSEENMYSGKLRLLRHLENQAFLLGSIVAAPYNRTVSYMELGTNNKYVEPLETSIQPYLSRDGVNNKVVFGRNEQVAQKSPIQCTTISHNPQTRKIILFWTPFFRDPSYGFKMGHQPFIDHGCAVTECETTNDRRKLGQSDVLVMHMAEPPIFFDRPKYRKPHQQWVFFMHESPLNTPGDLAQWNGLFNRTMTYRLDSDIPMPYNAYADYKRGKPPSLDESVISQPGIVAWVSSNCNTHSERELFVIQLARYVQIDVFGSCGNMTCPNGINCMHWIGKRYKFFLAFENSLCLDYITEKSWNALKYGMVPVVLGAGNYRDQLPPNSFIDVRLYKSPKYLAQRMIMLSKNKMMYRQFFSWKKHFYLTDEAPMCKLCEYLHQKRYDVKPKVYDHIDNWWSKNVSCMNPHDFYGGGTLNMNKNQ